MWPQLKIVHGKPRHSQSQGSVERCNRDVGEMVRAWMNDNKSKKWSEGLRFVQFQKNNGFHSVIKQSPFEALFGKKAKLGLASSSLPDAIINKISCEEDLYKLNGGTENTIPEPESQIIEQEKIMTRLNKNKDNIKRKRQEAVEGLEKQAKKMLLESNKKFAPLNIGQNVTIPISEYDRSKADFRNIIGNKLE